MQHVPSKDDFHKRNKNIIILFDYLRTGSDDKFIEHLSVTSDNEIDVNVKDEQGNMLIFFIVMNNKKRLLLSIVERGAKLDVLDSDGRSVLFYPIKFNHCEIIETLIEIDKKNIGLSLINIRDNRDNTPIAYAIRFANKKILNILLSNGADPNIKNALHFNALHMAIKKKDVEMAIILIKYISNLNSRTKEGGTTALHYSCIFMLYDVTKKLLELGANQNISELDNDFYPIFYSITQGDFRTAKLLIDNKASPSSEDISGNTFVHYAFINGQLDILDYIFDKYPIKPTKLFSQSELISSQSENSINPNISNIDGQTIVHLLIENYKPDYKKYLSMLIPHTNLNNQNNKGNTIIHLLAQKGILFETKDLLKSKKINIQISN